jgi:NAD-dependent deacetylase
MSSDPEKRIVFFTGAGISAECGLPTYRGPGGIWDEYDWESVACQRAFERDPQKVWDFQHRRRALYRDARPSRAHHMIRALQRKAPSRVAVITQNIDGLHQRAGTEDVLELHGNLWRVYCADPSCERHVTPWEIPGSEETDGRCPCGAWLRPDIVWFEDTLDPGIVRRAAALAMAADLFVVIGTSGVVWPAAALPREAQGAGATLVEINPEDTPSSALAHRHLRMGAAEGLVQLWPQLAGS